MKWENYYDDVTIISTKDKYGKEIFRNTNVAWASVNSANRPYLNEGIVIGFIRHPSFIYTVVRSTHNHVVTKESKNLIVIDNERSI